MTPPDIILVGMMAFFREASTRFDIIRSDIRCLEENHCTDDKQKGALEAIVKTLKAIEGHMDNLDTQLDYLREAYK